LVQNRRFFDYDRKGYITKTDFEEDRLHVRQALYKDQTFEQLDLNSDEKLTAEDFAPLTQKHLHGMLEAVESCDDEWLKNNHGVRLTSGWFKEHFSLEPNKNILPQLDLPIHVFSGEYDYMTPQFFAVDIEKSFKKLGKNNLTLHCFKNHDHDLNYIIFIIKGELSDGIKSIIDITEVM
jgi:hypothetical protein